MILFWLNPCTFYPTVKCVDGGKYYIGKDCIHSRQCDANNNELLIEEECDDGKFYDPNNFKANQDKCPLDQRPQGCSKYNMLPIRYSWFLI